MRNIFLVSFNYMRSSDMCESQLKLQGQPFREGKPFPTSWSTRLVHFNWDQQLSNKTKYV